MAGRRKVTQAEIQQAVHEFVRGKKSSGTPLFFIREVRQHVQSRGLSSDKERVTKAYNSLTKSGVITCLLINGYRKMYVVVSA